MLPCLDEKDLARESRVLQIERTQGMTQLGGGAEGYMRYVVEFELRSDLGSAVGEAIKSALVPAVGSVVNLRVVPMRTYTWNVELSGPVHVKRPANE